VLRILGIPRLSVALLALLATSCAAVVDQRGHLPEAEQIAQIRPGATTRDQVVKILGTPSSTGVFDDRSWYYISRKTKQVSFFEPDVLDQQVFVVNFNGQGVVQSVDHKGLRDARDIRPAPGATPAPGRELTFIEQVIGNVGRFNQGSGGGEGKGGGSGNPTGDQERPKDEK